MPWINCPLQTNAQKSPHQTAIIAGKQRISYAQFHSAVSLAQEWLKAKNIHNYSRVAIIAPNSVDYLITLLALWRQGAVACLMNPKLPAEAIQTQLKQIDCNHVFTQNQMVVAPFRVRNRGLKPATTAKNKYNLNQNATILFTSGSSTQPKAVMHTFGNHYYNALVSNEHIALKKGDRWLLSLPLYHVSGLGILFRALLAGATVVLPSKKEPLEESIQKYQITHISLVPTQLYRLLQNKKFKPPSLKAILLGGAPIPENLLEEAARRRLPIYITYGLTEMASQVATSAKNRREEAKILKYRQVKISSGEILVKGKTLFKGYVKGRRISLPTDKDGWFKTGDLGVLAKNHLRILGRKDNMFISGGENIQPEEIEQYLYQIKEIEQAVVVAREDKKFGFRPVAFVKMRMNKGLNAEKIKDYLRKFLPSFKIPDRFYGWPALADRPGPREQKNKGLKANRLSLTRSLLFSQ